MYSIVLQMIAKDLRKYASRFAECLPVTKAMLQFAVCPYCQHDSSTIVLLGGEEEKVEREFIFDLAKKLGVSSLRIFSGSWQNFLTCHELQQLIVSVAPQPVEDEDGSSSGEMTRADDLAPELMKIIDEFYKSRSHHDEDSCLLLTKYFKPGDVQYAKIVSVILKNAEHYDAVALLHLAQLQAANRRPSRKAVMDDDIFAIVSKAFEKLGRKEPSQKILDYVDWVFSMCTSSNRREPARSAFYTKFVSLVCKDAAVRVHLTGIVLRVLQRVEASHASLMKHSTTSQLGLALVAGYRQLFDARLWVCSHVSYAAVVAEMQRAQLECRHYVKDGQVLFQSEIVDNVQYRYRNKKKLMKLLAESFPPAATKMSVSA